MSCFTRRGLLIACARKGGATLSCVLAATAQTRRPLIAIGGISHESDSFNPAKTGLADFSRRTITAAELQDWKAQDMVSGFIEGARRFGLELYPTLFAGASPRGAVTDEAFNVLTGELIRRLKSAPKLDGLLLANHGAMVVESYPHGDAEVVRRIREALGPNFPIVVTHDFHACCGPPATSWFSSCRMPPRR